MPNLKVIQLRTCNLQQFFPSVYKKKKKLIEFLKACISGMAGMTCFKIWYAVSPDMWAPSKQFGPVWTRDHSATNESKIVHSC